MEQPGQLRSSADQALLDLASNDTLGLLGHPELNAAAQAAIASSGVGSGASRLISGSRPEHAELEQGLAQWLGRSRVLLFPSGFQANIAALQLLADRHTLVLADRRIHHSLLVGVRACGAKLERFVHNDLDDLEQRLQQRQGSRCVVLSESLFSMEGSSPDVGALAALCQRHGAPLLLDEAHALGVLGPGGRGLGHGLDGVSLLCGTFGKAFASGGAFLACGEALGEDGRALEAAAALEEQGVLVVAIRPPTVPEGEAMLRFSLRPHLPEEALSRVLATLEAFKRP